VTCVCDEERVIHCATFCLLVVIFSPLHKLVVVVGAGFTDKASDATQHTLASTEAHEGPWCSVCRTHSSSSREEEAGDGHRGE